MANHLLSTCPSVCGEIEIRCVLFCHESKFVWLKLIHHACRRPVFDGVGLHKTWATGIHLISRTAFMQSLLLQAYEPDIVGPALTVRDVARDLQSRHVASLAAAKQRAEALAEAKRLAEASGNHHSDAGDAVASVDPPAAPFAPSAYLHPSTGLPWLSVELDTNEPVETSAATSHIIAAAQDEAQGASGTSSALASALRRRTATGGRPSGWARPVGGMGLPQLTQAAAQAESAALVTPAAGTAAPLGDGSEAAAPFGYGPDGGRHRSMWAALAYNFSAKGQSDAASKAATYEEHLASAAAEAATAKEALLRSKLEGLERTLALDMDDPVALEQALNADWTHIRIGHVSSVHEEHTHIKKSILEHYTELSDVFKSFSGSSSKAGLSSMQIDEWLHFCASCAAFRMASQRAELATVFVTANGGRTEEAAALDEDSMSRFEFIEGVLLLAQLKFKDARHPSGKRITPGEYVETFLVDHIAPLASRLSSGDVRRCLREWSMQRFILEHEPRLRAVFDFYAALDEERERLTGGGTLRKSAAAARREAAKAAVGAAGMSTSTAAHKALMDVDEFAVMLEHCGLLQRLPNSISAAAAANSRRGSVSSTTGAEEGGGEGVAAMQASLRLRMPSVTLPLVRRVFGAVQRDDDGAAAEGLVANAAESAEQMVFGEFLEGAARIGVERWGKDMPNSTIAERVRWALLVVSWLADHLGRPRIAPLRTEQLILAAQEIETKLSKLTMPGFGGGVLPSGGGVAGARALKKASSNMQLSPGGVGEHKTPFITQQDGQRVEPAGGGDARELSHVSALASGSRAMSPAGSPVAPHEDESQPEGGTPAQMVATSPQKGLTPRMDKQGAGGLTRDDVSAFRDLA